MEGLKSVFAQTLGISLIFMVLLSHGITTSILAPVFTLYTHEASDTKKLSDGVIGIIIGTFDVANFFASLCASCILKSSHLEEMFALSIFTSGVVSLIFGIAVYLPNGVAFVGVCIFLRIIEGTCYAFGWSAGLCLIVNHYGPGHSNYAYSLANTAAVSGFIIGPTLGAFLYTVGNYIVPFLCSGFVSITLSSLFYLQRTNLTKAESLDYIVADSDDLTKSEPCLSNPKYFTYNHWLFFRRLSTICIVCGITTASFSYGFFETALAPHVKHTSSVTTYAVSWLLLAIAYCVVGLCAGKLYDKGIWQLHPISSLILVLSFFLQFLPKLQPKLNNSWFITGFLILWSSSITVFLTPTLNWLRILANKSSISDPNPFVCAVQNQFWTLGRAIGAMLYGGFIKENIGYYETCLMLSISIAIASFILVVGGKAYTIREDYQQLPD